MQDKPVRILLPSIQIAHAPPGKSAGTVVALVSRCVDWGEEAASACPALTLTHSCSAVCVQVVRPVFEAAIVEMGVVKLKATGEGLTVLEKAGALADAWLESKGTASSNFRTT